MANPNIEDIGKANGPALNKGVDAPAAIAKDNLSALSQSDESSKSAFQQLSKAYQDVAKRNIATLSEAMRALSAVKTPTEYIELQQKLVKEGIAAAVQDSERIGKLTAAVFAVPFDLAKNRLEATNKPAIN